MIRVRWLLLVVLAAVLAASCGGSDDAEPSKPRAPAASADAATARELQQVLDLQRESYGATGMAAAIVIDGQRHHATNTVRTEVRYEGAVPSYLEPTPAALPTAAPTSPIVTVEATDVDPIAQLKELAALRDAGILTDDEFTRKKTEILARL